MFNELTVCVLELCKLLKDAKWNDAGDEHELDCIVGRLENIVGDMGNDSKRCD